MTTYRWVGSIGSGQTSTTNPQQMAAILPPGQTLVRSRMYVQSFGYTPDAYSFAAVAFPFALVVSNSPSGPQWDPYSQWVTPESGVVLWSGMLSMIGNDTVPGVSPAQYASYSTMDSQGWNTQAQRRNENAVDQYIWLVGQLDPLVTVGQLFTAMAVRCLIATP